MKEQIFLYYTNDLHSYFKTWPQVVTYFNKKRIERQEREQDSFFIDIGDHVDRVHPITEATMGKANVKLLNDANYDVVTLGNNEGITLSHDDLVSLYDEANFNVVCSNLNSRISDNPNWLKHDTILETSQGVKIGFLGVTAAFNPYYNLLDWHVDSYNDVLVRQVPLLKEKADIIVLLSHVGINEDRIIAEKYSDIDVIIGGHTHHLLRTGEYVNETIITAAGKHCSFVGEVNLVWDHEEKKLVNKAAHTINVTHLTPDRTTEIALDRLQGEATEKLSKPIANLEENLEVDWFNETKIMKQVTDHAREITNVDCALLNAGLLIESLPAGPVTYGDIHRICPHPINLCVVSLTGYELLEVIRASLTAQFMNLPLKGFGFRGKLLGRMVFSGIDVETNRHEDGSEYVVEVLFNGQPLDTGRTYSVVTADAFTFGRILPKIAKSTRKDLYLPQFIRDILKDTLIAHYGGK